MARRGIGLQPAGLFVLCLAAAGCAGWPRVDSAYHGNGDAQILAFMRGNYMSSEAGIARQLERHLVNGLQPGQAIDRHYLRQRGASCVEGTPAVCTFSGIADGYLSGLPRQNADKAHRVTRIAARVLLLPGVTIDVSKELSYPDAGKRPR